MRNWTKHTNSKNKKTVDIALKMCCSDDGKRFYMDVKDIIKYLEDISIISGITADKVCEDTINELLDYSDNVDIRMIRERSNLMKHTVMDFCGVIIEGLKRSKRELKKSWKEQQTNGR